MEILGWVLAGLGVYAVIGLCFAAWFVVAGVGRLSPGAVGSGWGFRLLILPGCSALWPLLAWSLVRAGGATSDEDAAAGGVS